VHPHSCHVQSVEKIESVYRKMRQFTRTWTRDDLMSRQASCPPDYLSHADSSRYFRIASVSTYASCCRRHQHRKSNDASEDVTFDRSVSEPKETKKGNECVICLSKPCTAGVVHGERYVLFCTLRPYDCGLQCTYVPLPRMLAKVQRLGKSDLSNLSAGN